MGNMLDSPKREKAGHNFETEEGLKSGVTGMQGWRLDMEDDHILAPMASRRSHTLCAIFDGHGGDGAAKYAAKNLMEHIERTDDWQKYTSQPDGEEDVKLLEPCLTLAMKSIDVEIRKVQDESRQKSIANQDTSGCTAIVCIVTRKYIVCANVGDSRSVLSRNDGTTEAMSEDHKPNNELERRRIEEAGGFVSANRVEGNLAVSRALGDFEYKNRDDLGPELQKVSNVPDIKTYERTNLDDILLLACDGLWDVMSNEEATSYAREIYNSGEEDMMVLAEEMVDRALELNSRDNISCLALALPGMQVPAGEGVAGMRKQRESELLAQREVPRGSMAS